MLMQCPECDLQVSDRAVQCPHCGYPLRPDEISFKSKKKTKRMRLPNGFGQISEIKGQCLREPFRVLVTVGKNSKGRPICKPLKPKAYFSTYNDAYAALVEYHKNPYDLETDITVKELYDTWTASYFKELTSDSSIRTIKSAWNYCHEIYDYRVKDLRARHIKGCMENGTCKDKNGNIKTPSSNTMSRIKSLFNLMLDYAVEYEIVDKNVARTFEISDDIIQDIEENTVGHMDFTDEEMKILWKNVDTVPYVDLLIIQCYSGWRPQELGLIELENVDLNTGTFQGGMKTEAGKHRIVPIHPVIMSLVKRYYDEAILLGSKYLFNCTDTATHRGNYKLTYDKYHHRIDKIVEQLKLNPQHRPHDGRFHFITQAKKYKVDEYAIKYMVGHAIKDITESKYTNRELPWLIEEMQKIK